MSEDTKQAKAAPSIEALAALVASWRAHWAVSNTQGADHESASLGAGIEKCADELEALINERRA